MGAHNELNAGKSRPQQSNDELLPARVKVHLNFINEDYSSCSLRCLLAEKWIQASAPVRQISDKGHHVAHAITEVGQRESTFQRMLQRDIARTPVLSVGILTRGLPNNCCPTGRFENGADCIPHCGDVEKDLYEDEGERQSR